MKQDQQKMVTAVGTYIMLSQSLERMLKTLLVVVLPDEPLADVVTFERKSAEVGNKSLGYLIRNLKTRANYHPTIEKTLLRYRQRRNQIVHDFHSVPGSNFETPDDAANVDTFMTENFDDLYFLIRFFSALLYSWGPKVGAPFDELPLRETINDIERKLHFKAMIPILDELIFSKSS